MVYRKLNRTSSHRKATLRSLVTHLIEHESITTTHAKAKEAQTATERLIQLAKNRSPNLDDAKTRALQYIYKPTETLPKLFGELSERYGNRAGGYTRVLKLEPRLGDNAPQSILELVDGKRDMKFALTARAVARLEAQGQVLDKKTKESVKKIYRSRPNGEEEFQKEVAEMKARFYSSEESLANLPTPKPKKQKASLKFVENPLLAKKEAESS
ncbi:mitochondrial 54S ribosomal protein bL17m [Magnusiomyces paraingens]|uniref:Ribosomal protein L17 n=1 Tax=Magnusiomyces paraingens TaxID=2606893 RepID=A0A5E8C6F2_9ASCO|nr:uncharacterized protein SAPINGB_P006300 [Saprochaete ingens]VVT58620.1 unnamed protein product [Saprochaete ingens]